MDKVGEINIWGNIVEIYSENIPFIENDNIEFFNDEDKKEKTDKGILEDWAVFINSPWSQKNLGYKTELNCKDAYTKIDVPKEKIWRTIYSIVGYDGLICQVIGYGETEVDSLIQCTKLFDYIQKIYNPDNESC